MVVIVAVLADFYKRFPEQNHYENSVVFVIICPIANNQIADNQISCVYVCVCVCHSLYVSVDTPTVVFFNQS